MTITVVTAICAVLSVDRMTSHLIPLWQDIEVLEAINKALTPVADFTDLSGEQYASISAVKPVLSHMSTEALADREMTIHPSPRKLSAGSSLT